ncbi:hypothetical protein JCM3774_002303 [Rhodotorula dairenensis]
MYSPALSTGLASPALSTASDAPLFAATAAYASTSTGRTKRTAAGVDYAALDAAMDDDNDDHTSSPAQQQGRPAKRRAPRSTAVEKQARKVARMERNRIAAQVSRDKKKQQQELLEARIAELEHQLAHNGDGGFNRALSTRSSPPPVVTVVDPQLKEENESLKTQLALEKLHSQSLQIRLAALESKFSRLEQLLSGQLSPRSTRGRFIPAAEAVLPVPPVLSEPSTDLSSFAPLGPVHDGSLALLTPAATATASDFSPFDDFAGPAADLDFDLGAYVGGASDLARDPSLDPGSLFGSTGGGSGIVGLDTGVVSGPLFSSDEVSQAWLDWSLTATPAAPLGSLQSGAAVDQGDFDLVAFLREQQEETGPPSSLSTNPFAADAVAF